MKKIAVMFVVGAMALASSCGQGTDAENAPIVEGTDGKLPTGEKAGGKMPEVEGTDGKLPTGEKAGGKIPEGEGTDSKAQGDAADDIAQNGKETDETGLGGEEDTTYATLDGLAGEYDYPSEGRSGRLTIQKTSDGYDISDYESEASYRFLANSSNIETIKENRITIKYPEQVFSDDTVLFCYYILEYSTDGIDVYYGKSTPEEAKFLYHATKADGKDVGDGGNAEELFDLFLHGSIGAVRSTDPASEFYITDLKMDSGEWDSYSVGEKDDLDNDGEDELILCGPYGGIYLDARDNRVYEFAAGEGTGNTLSYVVYQGATWVMYSNRMHAGYELYYMEKYEGADNLVAEMNFSAELIDANNIESGMKYTLNGAEISSEEFAELAGRICATEVYTD